ncbi:hypothetical protein BYT27DRAFT_7211570 [Phlegmacium glaucopus]|nr:hypothetical protein BYT27DRAFT_7211570 [Phlegmacium glaucopus]
MPRPRPLTNVAPAHYNPDQQLTPRTPHSGSRTSRAEQGFAQLQIIEANDAEDDDRHDTFQSAPLLASSSSARFSSHNTQPPRRSTKSHGQKILIQSAVALSTAVSRLPLALGIFTAGILLLLIVLSFTRPEALRKYVGAKAPNVTVSTSSIKTEPTSPLEQQHGPVDVHLLSYENYTTFPLHPPQYLAECTKLNAGYMAHGDYWDLDLMGATDVAHHEQSATGGTSIICSSTITYMLDGTVGLTADLALMAQAAALAREQNRTFLVDDTYWNRGKWTDHFEDVRTLQPGPEPNCVPPPANELVACPRTARHWVILARTAKFHFGHGFSNHYDDAYAHEINRLRPIFEFALQSFESTIRPNAHNFELIKLTQDEFRTTIHNVQANNPSGLTYLAIHVRRGDRKPASFGFLDNKIPLPHYLDAVQDTWARLHSGHESKASPIVYFASDSPDVGQQFSKLYNGPSFSLLTTKQPRLRALASPREYYQKTFNELDIEYRVLATRGMIVDLAMISGLWASGKDLLPEATICSISSNVCKLAAVGLGWDRAFGKVDDMGSVDQRSKHWVEIDEEGQIVPVWHAFELF